MPGGGGGSAPGGAVGGAGPPNPPPPGSAAKNWFGLAPAAPRRDGLFAASRRSAAEPCRSPLESFLIA